MISEIVHSGRFAFGRSTDGGWFFAERVRRSAKPLTPQQAARLLGCKLRFVYELFHRGELRGHRVGKLVRIDRASVREYKERNANGPTVASQPPARSSPAILRNFTL